MFEESFAEINNYLSVKIDKVKKNNDKHLLNESDIGVATVGKNVIVDSIVCNESSETIFSTTSTFQSKKKLKKSHGTSSSNSSHQIVYNRGYFVNPRGFKLACQEFIPPNPKGIIIILHGYGDHGQGTLHDDGKAFAEKGFASFLFDHQGHGLSEGLPAYIRDFDDLVEDSLLFIDDVSNRYPLLKKFIYCCSMGGAIGLLVSLKRPEIFDGGLILLAPLIKLDETMVPNPILVQLLTYISNYFPTLAIVPGENVLEKSIKDPVKRLEHASHPLTYRGRARLGTGLAILKVTDYLQSHLEQVKVPLFIGHGSLDLVSSPVVSEELYNKASSTEKTLKIYENFWHGMMCEPDSYIVYNDIFNWIQKRLDSNDNQDCEKDKVVPPIGNANK
ncbi:hypothetical protein CYY_000846 [Polysphondylium violaceum]|uniref:Serine aminopeptidase S33 domain-containing protein n=1 Tax=Polysphondylium violaceum TaxID=133409 RepID=A0A8J4Q2Y3_9MYCE|nr:hypothetical protein CYY_000846 [Polysphondylium violaceum]